MVLIYITSNAVPGSQLIMVKSQYTQNYGMVLETIAFAVKIAVTLGSNEHITSSAVRLQGKTKAQPTTNNKSKLPFSWVGMSEVHTLVSTIS